MIVVPNGLNRICKVGGVGEMCTATHLNIEFYKYQINDLYQ